MPLSARATHHTLIDSFLLSSLLHSPELIVVFNIPIKKILYICKMKIPLIAESIPKKLEWMKTKMESGSCNNK